MRLTDLRLYKEIRYKCTEYNIFTLKPFSRMLTTTNLLLFFNRLYSLECLIERGFADKIEANVISAIQNPQKRTEILDNMLIALASKNNGVDVDNVPISALVEKIIYQPCVPPSRLITAPILWNETSEGCGFWSNAGLLMLNDTRSMTKAIQATDIHNCLKLVVDKFYLIRNYYDRKSDNKSI